VAIFTGVSAWHVIGRFARNRAAVVTAKACTCDRFVIDPAGTPSGRIVAIFTAVAAREVIGRLARCRGAVMAG
jgi:hypothetical protein